MKSLWIGLIALAGAAQAQCPPEALMAQEARNWLAGKPVHGLPVASMADGACAYAGFRAALEAEMGAPVGVKVGFTSAPAQQAFGVPGPVAGALFARMLLPNGAELSLAGARKPLFEADLLVSVADAAINTATTREQAAASLHAVQAFVELPDLALAPGVRPTGPLMAAYGVLPWRGVLGQAVPLADLDDPVADLGGLSVTLQQDGETVAEAGGAALLGHPLDVVLWLVQNGAAPLQPGDVISLGSLGPLTPAQPGHAVSAQYSIGDHTLNVGFTLTE